MSARRKKKTSKNRDMYSQVNGILLLALSLFCYFVLTAPDRTGGIGLYIDSFLRLLAGESAFVLALIIALVALKLILPLDRLKSRSRFGGLIGILILYSTWVHLQLLNSKYLNLSGLELFSESMQIGLDRTGGGFIGSLLAGLFLYLFGYAGTYILVLTLALICMVITLNLNLKNIFTFLFRSCRQFIKAIKQSALFITALFKSLFSNGESRHARQGIFDDDEMFFDDAGVSDAHHSSFHGESGDSAAMKDSTAERSYNNVDDLPSIKLPDSYKDEEMEIEGLNKTGKNYTADYQHPPLDLLTKPRLTGEEAQLKNIKNMAKLLENTLLSFGVKARVLHVQSGPTVTRFEVQPEAGVKVSKIINLSDDLALNLAAPLVRIEAPIPGKAALGIEVPNKVIALVHLREVIEDSAFQNSTSPLTVGLGKDITGIPVISDLSKMPHLLIAGSTGSGKSVCLNTIITSILYKADPAQVRFLMIDPKVVELSNYNGIPHLLMPVLTDPRKASLALKNMVREMSRRYDLFAAMGLRDINAYNDLRINNSEIEPLPYIVIVIDELADLMIVSPAEVEDSIARLAQMSRAAGIHLLVATQRPSVDVLTGIIKANITSRVAFTVSSQVDSRTILDMAGAEKLLGSGDMLFYPVGVVKPFRVQGAFVSEEELNRITNFLKVQSGSEDLNGINLLEPSEHPEEESDSLFYEAADLVVRTGQASISLFQRRFRIGYTRAARLIDDLERRGIVGPFEGSKPRAVLITVEQAAKLLDEKK